MMRAKESGNIEVTGIVLPSDWDGDDQLVEMVLYGNDESEHVITGVLSGAFLGMSHYRIRAKGRETTVNGRRMLDVTRYEVLGTGADSGYELDGLSGIPGASAS